MKRFPWHTVLIALYSVFFLFAENIKYVKTSDLWSPLIIVVSGSLVLLLLNRLILKNTIAAGIITTVMVLIFFSYGHYHELLYPKKIPIIGVRLDHNFYKWSSGILIALLYWRLIKAKQAWYKLNGLLNFVAILLLAMPLYKIFQDKAMPNMADSKQEKPILQQEKLSNTPSIYYLVMDAYGRNDVLRDMYGFDNSEFTDWLKEKGFYIAEKSFANYNKTVLSIPSAMSMNYLDSLAEVLGKKSENQTPLLELIDKNPTVDQLKAFGYTSFAFDAPILDYLFMDSADLFYTTPGAYVNLFENELLNTTIIRAFKRKEAVSSPDQWEHHRKKILKGFEKVVAVSKRDEPYYVHGHILAPHQPFVFDREGNAQDPKHHYTCWYPVEEGRDPEEYRTEYIEQLEYVNEKLKQTVEAVLENSKQAPIIIIQGDHGPCAELTNTKTIEGNNFRERMPILNAYFFPDQNYDALYPSISPVNSFRLVLSQYFGRDLPLLQDSAFYSTWEHNYDFVNVTDSLN